MSRPMRRFAFRLALALGKTVKQLLSEIDSQELSEWLAFYNLEPFGDEWRQTGMQVAASYNCWTTKKKPFQAEEFMPVPKKKQTPKEGRKLFEAAVRGMGQTSSSSLTKT